MLALHGNWVDLIIIVVLIFFVYQGFIHGLWSILIDFVSFFGSLLISLRLYPFISSLLQANFSFTRPMGNALGFLISAVLIEIGISFALSYVISKFPRKILKSPIASVLGVLLSFGQGLILVAFTLTFIISLPVNPSIKTDISDSKIGSRILAKTTGIEKAINNIFGGAINESLTYLTIEPKSRESVPVDSRNENLTVDNKSETQMFAMVNNERTSRGIKTLTWDTRLVVVARDYARYMWENHYFGHYDLEGKDVGDRLTAAHISYQVAGENLALAPTVDIAHTGLMNSPGHRANILDKDFNKIGIGVIDNGFYGKMFVQVFTN